MQQQTLPHRQNDSNSAPLIRISKLDFEGSNLAVFLQTDANKTAVVFHSIPIRNLQIVRAIKKTAKTKFFYFENKVKMFELEKICVRPYPVVGRHWLSIFIVPFWIFPNVEICVWFNLVD